jgi:proteinaceous RNase P
LIITNDEMRDHTFQILEGDFFPKWKERHQVWIIYLTKEK